MLSALFGARAQVVMGCFMATVAAVETYLWWNPTLQEVYVVSMEALMFAAYGVLATGLGFRATERVEAHVEAVVNTDSPTAGPESSPTRSEEA